MSGTTAATPRFFATPAALRAWFARYAATRSELIVGFHKVGSGRRSITWPKSVDEALCQGWIDGVRRRIDEHSYQIRFTPRKSTSIWSQVNIRRANTLIQEGRMQPAGQAAFDRRTERRSNLYAYEQRGLIELAADDLARFQKRRPAWRWFESQAPSYRRTMVHWIVRAVRAETRARRLAKLIAACAAGTRLLP